MPEAVAPTTATIGTVVAGAAMWLVWQRSGATRASARLRSDRGFRWASCDKAKDKLERRRRRPRATRSSDGIDKAADVADEKTGGKYDDKIDTGAEKAKDAPSTKLDGKDDDTCRPAPTPTATPA